jgi:hypothetical protein
MTKVLAQPTCCARTEPGLKLSYGEKDLLDDFHRARSAGRLSAPPLVGLGVDRPHPIRLVVGRLPKRLVLRLK